MATPSSIKDEATEALEWMQKFDVATLPRERELGSDMNFHAVVEPAQRLVELYKRLSMTALEDISGGGLGQIRERANADYSVFKQILDFKLATQSNPDGTRQSLIQQVIAMPRHSRLCIPISRTPFIGPLIFNGLMRSHAQRCRP